MIKIEKTLLFIIVLVFLVGIASATETPQEDQSYTNDDTVVSDISTASQDNKETIKFEEKNLMDDNPIKIDESKTQSIEKKTKDSNLKQDGIIEVHNYTELQNAVNNTGSTGVDTTIRLLQGSYNNTETITWNTSGMVLTIDGNGQTINGHQQQVFSISNGASMILKNIIITNYNGNEGGIIYNDGTLTLVNSTLENNQVIEEIGQTSVGIIYNNGTLIINDTSLNNNSASHGAIENIGTLIINNSTLNNNTAFEGGSIHNGGTLTINNSTLNNNTAHQEGGAIYNTYPGIITITDSILNYNTAINGGVIRNIGTLTISNSTLNHNTAKDEWFTSGLGGAIYNMRTLTLTNSTLKNNTAERGGAIFDTYSLNIKTSTFEENKATSGGAIFGNANPGLSCNITQNIFKKNTADDKETLVFNSTYNEKLIKNNTYESTDIKLKTINITLQEEKTYLAGEDVKLNITLTLEQPENYDEDIQEKISKTIYLNNEQIGTTIQTNYTITNIHIGENKVYVTCYNQQSNNLSFTVNGNYETNVSNYTELVQAVKTATTERYVSYKINLLPGDYNATKGILWYNTTTKNIIINGNNNTIDMKKHWLLFYIPEEQEITLENIIITNGSNRKVIDNYGTLTINNSTLENFNSTSPISSSINNFGILTINNSTIKNNYAIFGGAIYNFNNGILTINNSTLENNNAERGGAIYNDGILTIMDSTLKDNIANETESIIFNNGTINKIENTKFDCNYPANFIIENDVITLKSDDDFITVGNFTIIMDDEELQGSENFENFPVLPNSKNVKLILNGTDIKTANNQFILRKPKETNITCYTELVNAIEEAKIMDYSIYKINLLPGDYNATTSINWENSATKKIIINGNNNTLNGQNTHQFIKINSGHNLTLENIIITNATSSNGGAINNYRGTLTVSNSTFKNNQATMDGGAIRNYYGTLTVSNSTFKNNQAGNGGGAIDNYYSTLTVSNSTFKNNTAGNSGGGAIYDRSHNILTNITSCNFINNTASRGAAIHATGWINLTNNTFKENTATSNQETIDLNGYWNGILEGNVYESTDIALDEIILSVNNNHRTPEGVELNYTIQPVNPMYYGDFEDGINDITLYINGQKNITTKYENYTLSGLELGEYEVYYTTCNQQSNTITFKVICDAEVNVTNYTQLVQAIENATREEYNIYKINLQPGDYNATQNITWNKSATRKIVINGNGNTLDGQNTYQFINIAEGQELILDNITIRNYTSENSGAIYNNGTLTINNSTLEYNNITRGVIWNYGTLTINNSTLENNIGFTGGAIDNTYGTVIIINSTLEKNHAYRGGAIFNDGILTIKDSTIENNTAVWEGGAIFANDVQYSYVTLTNSNFTYNTAEKGAVIYQYSNSKVHFNMTNNLFKNNTARDKETLNFGTVNNERIMEENRYVNTDILLNEIKLSIADNQNYVILNYTIKPANPDYYLDFEDGLNDITIYINGEKNITTKYENTTLTDLQPGAYTAYFTSCNQQSNTITFIIKADSQIKTPETVYEYYSEVNNKIPLIITDISGQKGTITVTVKDQDEYKKLFIGFNVENGYNLSSQRLVEELENLYKNLDSSYVINVTYSSDFTLPSSTEFTLNINKQRNTTIVYDILNNTEGNVQINITVQDAIYKTPIADATIQITGDINQNTTSGILTDNTLTPGDYTINVKYPETEDYKESQTTIDFTVEIDKDKKIAELEEQVENLTEKLDEAQDNIENLTNQLERVNNEIETLNNTISNLTTQLEDAENKISTLNNTIENITQQLEQAREEIETLNNTNNNLTEQLEQANSEVTNLAEQLEEAQQTVENLAKEIEELTKASKTTLTIDSITDIKYMDVVLITGGLVDADGRAVPGNITLNINGENVTAQADRSGTYEYEYTFTKLGENTITATYDGTEKFTPSNANITVEVVEQDTVIIFDEIASITSGEKAKITGQLLDANGNEVYGTVKLLINNGRATVKTDNEGKFIYEATLSKVGVNNITARYLGSAVYNPANATTTVDVTAIETSIELDEIAPIKSGESITISGKLVDANGNPVVGTIKLLINNGRATVKTDSEGVFTYDYVLTKVGTNNITVAYLGANRYTPCEAATTVTVGALNTKLTIDPVTAKKGEKVTITGKLVDENGNAVVGTVKLLINGGRATVKTDENGVFSYEYTVTKVGANNITSTYDGSNRYTVSTATSTINVAKAGTKITLNPISTVTQKTLVDITGQLSDENGNGIYGTVKLLINNGRATVKTDKTGVFTYSHNATRAGENTITANYLVSNNYEASETTTTFTVVKA